MSFNKYDDKGIRWYTALFRHAQLMLQANLHRPPVHAFVRACSTVVRRALFEWVGIFTCYAATLLHVRGFSGIRHHVQRLMELIDSPLSDIYLATASFTTNTVPNSRKDRSYPSFMSLVPDFSDDKVKEKVAKCACCALAVESLGGCQIGSGILSCTSLYHFRPHWLPV